jgi:uncharacterized protein YxeA
VHYYTQFTHVIRNALEYIGWGPFILIIVGLLTSWIPLGIILLIIGVAWAIFKHINLGNIEWYIRMTDNTHSRKMTTMMTMTILREEDIVSDVAG